MILKVGIFHKGKTPFKCNEDNFACIIFTQAQY